MDESACLGTTPFSSGGVRGGLLGCEVGRARAGRALRFSIDCMSGTASDPFQTLRRRDAFAL